MSVKEFLKTKLNPSVAILHAEQVDLKNQLALLEDQITDPDLIKIIGRCKEKISELEKTIDNRQIAAAWRILHRVQEELLLLVSPAQLACEGQRVIQSMQLSALSDAVKKDWTAKLEDAIKKIENSGKYEEMKSRQLIKMASNVINDFTDDSFWDIWTKRFMSFIYISALAVLLFGMAISYNNELISPGARLSLNLVMLLGALGGFASGIWGSSQEYFAKGYFWINTLYYSLVRPVAGILGAILMFWLLMGQSYIKVEPPLPPCQIAPAHKHGELVSKGTPTITNCPCPELVSSPTSTPTTDAKDALITFRAPQGMSVFPYMLLLLIAGFAGDKLLKSVTDKVMTKLFNEAEKSKDAAKGGG